MENKVVFTLLLLCGMQQAWSLPSEFADTAATELVTEVTDLTTPMPAFSCAARPGITVELDKLAGDWFEVARVPNVEQTQCLKYVVPKELKDNKLEIQMHFISTVNDKWDPAHETVSFPWSDTGIFTGEVQGTPVKYMIADTDHSTYALICGELGSAGRVQQVVKLWTRDRLLTDQQIELIKNRYNTVGNAEDLFWLEQRDAKCSGFMCSAGSAVIALCSALLLALRSA
ncbi:uncharacterized protein LOC108595872 [Drosophila busckii]|uniref:uncharacterized protein LOC108595872 n=1 Tax=Drosophila busckii TaxID=30019 RepID=UPI00083F36A0|nr:uncharacterized protein LOC108595872 [Drosophila busckii]